MGALTYGMPNALPRVAEPDEHRIQFTDVFSKQMGRHSLKFGGDINNVHEIMINLFQGGGIYGYGESNNTANFEDWVFDAFAGQSGNTDPYAGFHYNSFVQTVDTVNTKAGTQGNDNFWMNMIDGFVEDSWKVNQKLTVTAGARYDVQITPAPGLINTNYAPLSNTYTQTIKNVLNRVQPRIGFSYSPINGTVIRGGYGLYSALNQGSTYYAMRVENGVVQRRRSQRHHLHHRAQYSQRSGVSECAVPAHRPLAVHGALSHRWRCSHGEWPVEDRQPELPRAGPELCAALCTRGLTLD